jgi:hypothetical protein
MNSIIRSILFLSLAIILSGCVQQYSNPSEAKAGGVVQIGLGGIKRNAGANTLRAEDLTVTIKDASGAVYPLQTNALFRVYPDHASNYIINRLNPNDETPSHSNTLPYDGGWYIMTILTDADSVPLPLVAGNATISITSPKLVNLKAGSEGDLSKIKIRILAGTTSASIEQTEQFNYYKPHNHLNIKPTGIDNNTTVSGAQIRITYNNTQFDNASLAPQVVPLSHDPNMQLLIKQKDLGNGTSELIVNLTNPRGFVAMDNWVAGKSSLADLNLMVVPASGLDANWPTYIQIDSANSFYMDLNGVPIVGAAPVLEAGLIE